MVCAAPAACAGAGVNSRLAAFVNGDRTIPDPARATVSRGPDGTKGDAAGTAVTLARRAGRRRRDLARARLRSRRPAGSRRAPRSGPRCSTSSPSSRPSTLQMAASRGRPFSSECMCTSSGATRAMQAAREVLVAAEGGDHGVQRAVHGLGAEGRETAAARVVGEEGEELPDLLGVHLADHQPAGVHAPGLGEQRRDVGVAVHAEAHAEGALLERRQVGAALDGDEALVDGDDLEQGVEQRRLPGGPVAEDDERAAVAEELRRSWLPGRR